jgi:hypothetical protein
VLFCGFIWGKKSLKARFYHSFLDFLFCVFRVFGFCDYI